MVRINAHNESAAAEELFAQDIDIGAFFHAFCRKLEASVSAAQAKAIMKEMDFRYSKKAILETWRERGELHTVSGCSQRLSDRVKEVCRVELGELVKNLAEKRGCDTNLDSVFIREFGEIYFNDTGKNVIIMELQYRDPKAFEQLDDSDF